MTELPEPVHEEIKKLSSQGDLLADEQRFGDAVAKYTEAWVLVPEPKTDWEASTWLLAALGDAYFLSAHFAHGVGALEQALSCPGGFGNPFIHLRLGQCHLEQAELPMAAEHLARAYMLAGKEIFAREDSKYFEFLKTRLSPPASGEW